MNDSPAQKPIRIAFVGGPGCGKTTLTHDLFVQLKKLGYNAEVVPEWIRRDIMINGPMENVYEQYRTLTHHRKEEDHFPQGVEFLIQDGGTLMHYFYSALYAPCFSRKDILVIQDMYGYLLEDLYDRKYDHIWFLPRTQTAGGLLDDGTRYQTQDELQVLNDFMRLFFTRIHPMGYVNELTCPLADRVETVLERLLGEDGVARWKALNGGTGSPYEQK